MPIDFSHARPAAAYAQTLHFRWQRLDDMTAGEAHRLIQLRESVFVVEQACAYQEADDLDLTCWHLTALADDEIAGYLRVVDAGHKYREPSIGRVLTAPAYRRRGVGRALMIEGIRRTRNAYPTASIRISAQQYLAGFYAELGFEAMTAPYLEDGIPHIEMWLAGDA